MSSVKRVKEIVAMHKRKVIQGLITSAIGGIFFLVAYLMLNYLGVNKNLSMLICLIVSFPSVFYVSVRYFPREQLNDSEEETESPASDDASD